MSTQETVQKAQGYIKEFSYRRIPMGLTTEGKEIFDDVLSRAVVDAETRLTDGKSVSDFLSDVYITARRMLDLSNKEKGSLDHLFAEQVDIVLNLEFKPFVEEEVAHREAQLSTGESRK